MKKIIHFSSPALYKKITQNVKICNNFENIGQVFFKSVYYNRIKFNKGGNKMENFILSGFSDEIDASIDVQFDHLQKLGIHYFEPRGIDGKNISDLTFAETKELKQKMDNSGIKASSIGSPIGVRLYVFTR